MIRTDEEREQWFREFAKTLGYGTNPKNAADALIDHIYTYGENGAGPQKAFAKNPFTYNSSPLQRKKAIEQLMDAYEKNQLLAPDEKGEIRPIGKQNGKDFQRLDPKEPKLEGSDFSRSAKKMINRILPRAFAKDMEKEKEYEKDLKRYKELKALAEKNKVTILAMSMAKKQKEDEERSEEIEKEFDKNMKELNQALKDMPVLMPKNTLVKEGLLEKMGIEPEKDPAEELDINDLSKQELDSLKEYTMAYISAKASPEDLKKFLEHPGRRTVGMEKLVEEAKMEFAKKFKEFKDNPENEGKEFAMDDPDMTAEAVKNLSTVMQKENKLSPMHRTAAKFTETLVPAYKKQSAKLPNEKKPKEFDVKFLESMEKMAGIYAEGMAAKKTLLGMDSLKQNSQERLDALSKVGAMESVNAIMQDNMKSMTKGMVNPKTGLTKEQSFFTSNTFTKDFMQKKAARSTTIQNMAKDKPEDFHKKFLSLDDQMKMEKFGRTVNSEGSASLLKTMMNKQEAKQQSLNKEIAFNTPGINNPVKMQLSF